jgi:hypothetical protein
VFALQLNFDQVNNVFGWVGVPCFVARGYGITGLSTGLGQFFLHFWRRFRFLLERGGQGSYDCIWLAQSPPLLRIEVGW